MDITITTNNVCVIAINKELPIHFTMGAVEVSENIGKYFSTTQLTGNNLKPEDTISVCDLKDVEKPNIKGISQIALTTIKNRYDKYLDTLIFLTIMILLFYFHYLISISVHQIILYS